ncbi:MAG: putative selenate reductase subunit YgfK [Acidimicrobiia bacterium]
MSDRFQPISMEQLTAWVFTELEEKDSIFGIPRMAFFEPTDDDRIKQQNYGTTLETPLGVAAGPHTQMAQNIIVSWLVGARFIELKTVQTLDELDVNKPCIDLEDEGYNVEWSQELKVHQSFDEYLRAWVLIHALHHHLGFPGEAPGMEFNMSVGYNLEGILNPNVQWYLDVMNDASEYLDDYISVVAEWYPAVRDIDIPAQLSDTITLSTMHGCPPDEIEAITSYLMSDRGIHTSVKCNPTLLGPAEVRSIVNDELGYSDIVIPDEAFGHDLKYEDAIPMFRRLQALADDKGLTFGLKLSNTLEVENHRPTFPNDEMMYMSGRALHAVTVNLALKLSTEFDGKMLLSFAGGADAFNIADLMRSGMTTITVCSDLLKTGGYLRFPQYIEELELGLEKAGAANLAAFSANALDELGLYANEVRKEWRYKKHSFRTNHSKTDRKLGLFDCIEAPCVDECPVSQDVPAYMRAVREGRMDDAVDITRADNPVSAILGRVCDHLCETTCIRTHLDQPLAIRDMKRFIMSNESSPTLPKLKERTTDKVAIIGAGPAGIAAARDLGAAGIAVTIFEAHAYPGGMVGGAIPEYRLPQEEIDKDMAVLAELGVEVRYNQTAGEDFSLEDLRRDGYGNIFVAVGAQLPKFLGVEGEDADGVLDALTFLRSVREHDPVTVGSRVGVIGAGDTAMDCARSAWRVGADEVSIIYRRTTDQMPADPEEVHGCIEEGITIVEMTTPKGLHVEDDTLQGLIATKTEYRGDRDASGRKIPYDVPESDHEIPLDTLILAISQHSLLDFFGDQAPELTSRGYIAVDPETFASSVPGVYAGGDVAADGPSSIVKAAADGKVVADAIIAAAGGTIGESDNVLSPVEDLQELTVRRARREYRVPTRFTPLELRDNFDETALVFTTEEAQTEASRCVDCDTICSLCVGVCPNIALMTYQIDTFATELPQYAVTADGLTPSGSRSFRIDQPYQIAVLTDFCNECGNCVTACPTSGTPYLDKPRLYLDEPEFVEQTDNAFMISDDGTMVTVLGRFAGATHELSINGSIEYRSPTVTASFDEAFNVTSAEAGESAEGTVTLDAAATMYSLWKGVAQSMPEVPLAESGGTFIAAPALEG